MWVGGGAFVSHQRKKCKSLVPDNACDVGMLIGLLCDAHGVCSSRPSCIVKCAKHTHSNTHKHPHILIRGRKVRDDAAIKFTIKMCSHVGCL